MTFCRTRCIARSPPGRVAHDLGAIERRAQHRRVRDLAAQPAADAGLRSRSPPDRCAADRAMASPSATGSRTAGCRNGRRCRSRRRRRSACATTRSPRLSFSASSARTRRWRASWHSPSAMITLRPRSAVVIASLSVCDHHRARCRCAPCAATSRPWRAASARCPCRAPSRCGSLRSRECIAGRWRRRSRSA